MAFAAGVGAPEGAVLGRVVVGLGLGPAGERDRDPCLLLLVRRDVRVRCVVHGERLRAGRSIERWDG